MRRMLATLAVAVVGGMIGAALVSAVPASGSPGDPLILSSVNQAGPMTVLKSNGGFRIVAKNPARPPLMVYSPDSMPPLQVTSTAKVANLNADLFDGKDSTAFVQQGQLAMPAATYSDGDQVVNPVGPVGTVVRSVSLIPPADGRVIVNSVASVWEETAGDRVDCEITRTTTVFGAHLQIWESGGSSGGAFAQLAGTRGFEVAGGVPFVANLVCRSIGASGSSAVYDSALSAIFVPTNLERAD